MQQFGLNRYGKFNEYDLIIRVVTSGKPSEDGVVSSQQDTDCSGVVRDPHQGWPDGPTPLVAWLAPMPECAPHGKTGIFSEPFHPNPPCSIFYEC